MKVTNKEKQIIKEYLKDIRNQQDFCSKFCNASNLFCHSGELGQKIINNEEVLNHFNTCVYFLYFLLLVTNKNEAKRFKGVMKKGRY